jgi:hypothetical protein
MISITLKQHVAATPSQIRGILLEHEKLNRFFNADFLLIKERNKGEIEGGKGSIRQVRMSGVKFEERIISADNSHISYQIIGNKPVANHQGDIYFYSDKNTLKPMTEITYNICCKAPWWLPSAVLGFFIKKDLTHALKKLAINFKGVAI